MPVPFRIEKRTAGISGHGGCCPSERCGRQRLNQVTYSVRNYAERRDPVAFDSHLRDDFGPNARDIRVVDDLVINNYRSPSGEPNYHKSYGYLRTPELSKHIAAFLSS
jgi:hypothetical protein